VVFSNARPPHLVLIDWKPAKPGGALLGRAKIRLPIGLEIDGIGLFGRGIRVWASMPAEIVRDDAGQPLRDPITGKTKHRSNLRWSTRELQDGWSNAVVTAIEAKHGPLGDRS
jgi:hypothetical protein